jgi:hypothetical protein
MPVFHGRSVMANERRGEKLGWTLGWLGGFLWVAILSVILLVRREWIKGVSGLVLFCAAVILVRSFSPWRHPATRYWRLMAPPWAVLFVSIAWAMWAYGGSEASGMNWWSILWILPLLIPFVTAGRMRWTDSEVPRSSS